MKGVHRDLAGLVTWKPIDPDLLGEENKKENVGDIQGFIPGTIMAAVCSVTVVILDLVCAVVAIFLFQL